MADGMNEEQKPLARGGTARGMHSLPSRPAAGARLRSGGFPRRARLDVLPQSGPDDALKGSRIEWRLANLAPLVLPVDQIDPQVGDPRLLMLRRRRAGCGRRPEGSSRSAAPCGVGRGAARGSARAGPDAAPGKAPGAPAASGGISLGRRCGAGR